MVTFLNNLLNLSFSLFEAPDNIIILVPLGFLSILAVVDIFKSLL